MRLGKFETTANGLFYLHENGEKVGRTITPKIWREFVRDVHMAHERGEVIVLGSGPEAESLRDLHRRGLESWRTSPPLTADAIAVAVARKLAPLLLNVAPAAESERLEALEEVAEAAREIVARLDDEANRAHLAPLKCTRIEVALRRLDAARKRA